MIPNLDYESKQKNMFFLKRNFSYLKSKLSDPIAIEKMTKDELLALSNIVNLFDGVLKLYEKKGFDTSLTDIPELVNNALHLLCLETEKLKKSNKENKDYVDIKVNRVTSEATTVIYEKPSITIIDRKHKFNMEGLLSRVVDLSKDFDSIDKNEFINFKRKKIAYPNSLMLKHLSADKISRRFPNDYEIVNPQYIIFNLNDNFVLKNGDLSMIRKVSLKKEAHKKIGFNDIKFCLDNDSDYSNSPSVKSMRDEISECVNVLEKRLKF